MANYRSSLFPVVDSVPSLRDRVYRTIEEIVVDGHVGAGSHLREEDLASRLGVSRNPVREALQRLTHEGLADHIPGRGVFVHTLTLREIEDVFYVRSLLEVDCVRLATERISESELHLLEKILSEGDRATRNSNVSELLQLNERFHHGIFAASGNQTIANIMMSLSLKIRWYFSSVVSARAVNSWAQHRSIFQALEERDPERAVALMTTHLDDTLHALQLR